MRIRVVISAVLGVVLMAALSGFADDGPSSSKKKHVGKYFSDATVVAEGKACRVDSGDGFVLQIDEAHENPLFESKLPNKVHLLLWVKDGMTGQRYQLPSPNVEVCYWEQGDLLMFHTVKAMGWIEFAASETGQVMRGKMDMKLVEPDHNMSNSDYHYLGGGFTAGYEER